MISGDNELASLEFQKHYGLPIVHLLDPDRKFERRFNRDGWPFLMLADKRGRVAYHKGGALVDREMPEIEKLLKGMIEAPAVVRTAQMEGVSYMPATLRRSGETEKARRRDRFPSLACGPDGKVYVVFTSNRNGNSDVFIRVFDGVEWSEDKPIAATSADEYDGAAVVDKQNRVWVSWASNADGKNYNIFVRLFMDGSDFGEVVQVTKADDDAMHARMACDDKGRVWMTYYKWHKMGRWSRDKEVYVRRSEDGNWSEEVQVSPTDVPEYEDHSDPAITALGDGAVVCWSWDYHKPEGYTKEAETPTIFVRSVSRELKLGKAIAVSGKQVDVTPAIAAGNDGRIWCAWDSLGKRSKSLCVKEALLSRVRRHTEAYKLSRSVANVCSPCFAVSPKGRMTLLWSQTADGKKWTLKRADFDPEQNRWSDAERVESEGNPRFCSAAYDKKGKFWVSFSAETEVGREVFVQGFEKEVRPAGMDKEQRRAEGTAAADSSEAIRRLREAIDEKYSYRDLRGVDWNEMFERYGPLMERAKTPREFAEVAAKMLGRARDMHVWVKTGGQTVGGFKRKVRLNYNMDVIKQAVPNWRDRNEFISTGRFRDGIGYIMIKSWKAETAEAIEPVLGALRDSANAPSLIIDVRPNGGGSETLAREVAGCFVDEPVLYAKHVSRSPDSPGGFGKIQERVLKPNKASPKYRGRIAVLTGQANMSSCEAFLLMMKQVPNCTLIGARSYGSSGNPRPVELGNGVTVWLPSWKALRPDGTCFEGEGIRPDVLVGTRKTRLRKRDRVLERALQLLCKP